MTEQSAATFLGQEENAHIPEYLGGEGAPGVGVEQLVGLMDDLGVATGVITPGLDRHALGEARALLLDDEAMGLFLGGTARRLLDRT